MLAKTIESIHPDDGRKVIAIFDNDEKGQEKFNKLSNNFIRVDWCSNVKKHRNGVAWALILSEPTFRSGYADAKNLCIEYLFTDEILARPFKNGKKLEIKEPEISLLIGHQKHSDIPDEIKSSLSKDSEKFRKIGSGKNEFANEIVPHLNKEAFAGFEKTFINISKILEK